MRLQPQFLVRYSRGRASEAFWAVARRLRHRTKVTLEPWELTPSLARAMRVIAGTGRCASAPWPSTCGSPPARPPRSSTTCSGCGLAERRPDPADRRATLVALTAAGVETGKAIQAARQAEAERFFAALNPEDRDDLTRILRKLLDDSS